MSPVELQVLLWIFTRSDNPPVEFVSKSTFDNLGAEFLNEGLITTSESHNWQCTPRGVAFLEHVLNLPLPEQKWVMPGADTQVDT